MTRTLLTKRLRGFRFEKKYYTHRIPICKFQLNSLQFFVFSGRSFWVRAVSKPSTPFPAPQKIYKWVFPKIGLTQNEWFIMENPIKMDDLRGSFPPIFGNIQKNKSGWKTLRPSSDHQVHHEVTVRSSGFTWNTSTGSPWTLIFWNTNDLARVNKIPPVEWVIKPHTPLKFENWFT